MVGSRITPYVRGPVYDYKHRAWPAIHEVCSVMSLIPINNILDRMSVSIHGCLFLCVYVLEGALNPEALGPLR